jgi:predicted transcriptional regulator
MDATSIQIDKDTHKRLKIIAAITGKKLYELIQESVISLERKYNISDE